jgi:predicted RND superfamily exporter protein
MKIYEWATTSNTGKEAVARSNLGFINQKVQYIKVHATSIGSIKDSSAKKIVIYDQWDKYLAKFRGTAPI